MNTSYLWSQVKAFNLDEPLSEYGFSTRLAYENGWTISFTEGAILEYKKFMYLAATAEGMVSPSEIIDIVWHQHLIFTQSYAALCAVLGKKIEHVPSTHNKAEAQIFRQAKENTFNVYIEHFGPQNDIYWRYTDMYAPLGLPASGREVSSILNIAITVFGLTVFILSLYPSLLPFGKLIHAIDSLPFLTGYLCAVVLSIGCLELYNRKTLRSMIEGWNRQLFVFKLSPQEVIGVKTGKLGEVINACVNQLFSKRKIEVVDDIVLAVKDDAVGENAMEHCIIETIKSEGGTITYPALWRQMLDKPVFASIYKFAGAFKEHVLNSKMFAMLYITNISVLGILLFIGFIRLCNGFVYDKPVGYLVILLLIFTIVIYHYLKYTTTLFTKSIIPAFYKQKIIPEVITPNENWEWSYVMFGPAILAAPFVPLVGDLNPRRVDQAGACGGTASGCGSSCGSGGCGGGGCGGCGGCGGGD